MVESARYFLGKSKKDTRLHQLLRWIDTNADAMLDNPAHGLEAIGIGKKNADRIDCATDEWCVTGFVKRKLPEKVLKKREVQAFSLAAVRVTGSDDPLAGIEMDVVETGSGFSSMPALNVPTAQRGQYGGTAPTIDLQKRFDAIRIGIGVTNPVGSYPDSLGVGTIGFFVKDPDDKTYLVSNNHVIARENAAQAGNAIVQPGTLDLTKTELDVMNTLNKLRNRLQIGKLSAWIDLDFGSTLNEVDVAIAELNDERDLDQIARIGFGAKARGVAKKFSFTNSGALEGDTIVYKAGRTTGWTEGVVTAIGVASNVNYTAGTARFKNQIAVTASDDNGGAFSKAGDSGSGIWNSSNELVGLLYAGSSTRTLVNPIDVVMSKIEAELGRGKLTLVT